MKSLKMYYDEKTEELANLRKMQELSVQRLRALYTAKRHLTEVGGAVEYAIDVIDKTIKEEKKQNENLRHKYTSICEAVYDIERFLRKEFGEAVAEI